MRKPLTVPPHPLLSLVGTDSRVNRFRCANCDLIWIVDISRDEYWDVPFDGARLNWFPRETFRSRLDRGRICSDLKTRPRPPRHVHARGG